SALEAGLSMVLELGVPAALAGLILDALGEVGTELGQPDQARAWLVRCLEVRHEGGERFGVAQTLEKLGALAAVGAHREHALTLMGAADALYEDLGAQRTPADRLQVERWLLPVRKTLNTEEANAAWTHGRALSLDDAVALAVGGHRIDTP